MGVGGLVMVFMFMVMGGSFYSPINSQPIPSSNMTSILTFGAIGDGKTDDTQAFTRAWATICGAAIPTTLIIPTGMTFLVQPVSFEGPCNSSVTLQILGTVIAPVKAQFRKSVNTWLNFHKVDNLIVSGNGRFDGQGDHWWYCKSDVDKESENNLCETENPTALGFHDCKNLQLSDFTSFHSPRNHISINGCDGPIITNVHLLAKEDSPNTDGIDISQSTNVHINGAVIATGDDCIAINGGSSTIIIKNVTCGPGHGISVGSLGRNGATDIVSDIHVKNCTLTNTQNGVRIKTVPDGLGSATNITFEDITFSNVSNPILINQFYCPESGGACKETKSAVAVNGVSYTDLHGTSNTGTGAINFNCSGVTPCKGIVLNGINITPVNPTVNVRASCKNAQVNSTNTTPPVTCPSPVGFITMPLDYDTSTLDVAEL